MNKKKEKDPIEDLKKTIESTGENVVFFDSKKDDIKDFWKKLDEAKEGKKKEI